MDNDRRYLNHYGLIVHPFQDITDRRFIWLGEKQLENLAHLKIGIEQTKGVLLLEGEDGSGKSVLLGCLLKIIEGELLAVTLAEPGISVSQFFAFLAGQYKMDKKINTKADFLIHFRKFLLEARSLGKKVLLVVEDAENQNDDIIEEIRLLSNMDEAGNKLLSLLLIGNKDLEGKLLEHHHRALLQRVAVRCHIDPFTEKETAAYIRHRMMVAGSFLEIFTAEAVHAIHRFSGGIPSLINLICDHALMRGCLERLRIIDGKLIAGYAKEIRKTFGMGRGDLRSAALESLKTPRDPSRESRFFKLLPAAFVLAAILLLAVGVRFANFEKKPEVVVKSVFQSPISLYFEAGSTKLSTKNFSILDWIAEYLIKNPEGRATIKGYTDSKGFASKDMRISVARAEAAKGYLVRKGVNSARIQAIGMGSQQPAAGAESSGEKKLSRRVEIEIDTGKNTTR